MRPTIIDSHNSRTILNTCTKLFSDFPFAHRQPKHEGHCAQIHGHNWSFEVTFGAKSLDDCGFVVDFGDLDWAKRFLNEMFDHTTVLNDNDPARVLLEGAAVMIREGLMATVPMRDREEGRPIVQDVFKFVFIPDCSCEGIASYVLELLDSRVRQRTNDRVFVKQVKVYEDSKNSATATWA